MKKWIVFSFITSILIVISGCGSENRTASTQTNSFIQSASCIGCHASKTSSVTGVNIVTEYESSKHNTMNGASCGDCHKPAQGHPNPIQVSKDPDTDGHCFSCHNPNTLASHFYDYSSVNEKKATWVTQYPNGGSEDTEPASINKYCKSCHNPHATGNTMSVNKAWAKAGHGDKEGQAWKYYDFKSSSRATCSRCHTTTGLIQYITYSRYTSSFSFSYAWGTGKAPREVLSCVGCHEDYSYKLRNVGAIKAVYTRNTYQYSDIGKSNICMACHVGRETGVSIKNSLGNFSSLSFINSHYLTAGGQLFGTTGYEYTGLNYDNPTSYEHDKIGLNYKDTGIGLGPCVGCHMHDNTDEKHTFLPVSKNGNTITEIKSTVCAKCHTGIYALTPTKLTEEEEDYQSAIKAAMAVMAVKGIYFYEAHPYWYKGPDGTLGAFTNWASIYGKAKAKDVMGAAFNINLLAHDPGGYAHNRYYVKRLLWDSIDFMQDGVLGNVNMSTLIDGLASLTTAEKTAAKTYLGTTRP